MKHTSKLNKLLEKKRKLMNEIEDFVNKYQNELVKELCDQTDLDAEQNQVRIYGIHGTVDAFYNDNSKWHTTRQIYLSGNNWKI
jgi:hypothetical protein